MHLRTKSVQMCSLGLMRVALGLLGLWEGVTALGLFLGQNSVCT